MHPVSLICRNAPGEAVDLVERFFHEARLDTRLFVFGSDPDKNAEVAAELAEVSLGAAGGLEVWLVPSAFTRIEQEGQETAMEARAFLGLPNSEKASQRLLILLDDDELSPATVHVLRLSDLVGGRISPDEFRARLQEIQNTTGPKPKS
ncbi:hypothetical protein H9L13_06870 [Sphingomonas lutea]|uniref:Uncharacterized protein n=1 Tax=Sphingomonas lutea TaxID=1045317 RepID=A0A7G9SF29_9SPHN|nr:hypothetical protein [Sphingomonas lutea]QNN66454.1 hypothetical protein H9L13_06870 [Sphingomonas lutea]